MCNYLTGWVCFDVVVGFGGKVSCSPGWSHVLKQQVQDIVFRMLLGSINLERNTAYRSQHLRRPDPEPPGESVPKVWPSRSGKGMLGADALFVKTVHLKATHSLSNVWKELIIYYHAASGSFLLGPTSGLRPDVAYLCWHGTSTCLHSRLGGCV